ncbi:hypothetical protein [Variovorax sp. E3]|uniref:hypothetical protein n=1 Tax=Variovorax sp. E3 TaxID=1914993 RepID=UPI0018DCBD0B|nr:hypothetical protein [Variovorax sp. E3]
MEFNRYLFWTSSRLSRHTRVVPINESTRRDCVQGLAEAAARRVKRRGLRAVAVM